MAHNLPYRPCVGITLFNGKGQVFVASRIDSPGAWQMPQGGIDDGESAEDAFFRELLEEIGTDKARILHVMEEKLRYDLPPHLLGKLWNGRWGGQEQTWIAARFTGQDSDINLNAHEPAEFDAWRWVALEEAPNLIVPFKRETYLRVIEAFSRLSIP